MHQVFFRKSLKIAIDLALIPPKWRTSSTERPEKKKRLQRIPHLLPGFLLKKSRASMRFSNSSSFKPCNPPKPQDSARPKREEWGTTSDRDPWDSMGQYCKVPYLYPKDLSTWWVFRYISRCFLKNVPKNWCFQWTTFPLSGGTGPLVQNFLFAVLGWISGRGFVVHMPGPTGSPQPGKPGKPPELQCPSKFSNCHAQLLKNHLTKKTCVAPCQSHMLSSWRLVYLVKIHWSLYLYATFCLQKRVAATWQLLNVSGKLTRDVSAKTTSTTPYLSCNQLL